MIIAYHSVPTDDGRLAIVEYVARDRAAFRPLLKAGRQNKIEVLDGNRSRRQDILNELRRYKSNFDFSMLRIGAL